MFYLYIVKYLLKKECYEKNVFRNFFLFRRRYRENMRNYNL